jgi:hypothetical protein
MTGPDPHPGGGAVLGAGRWAVLGAIPWAGPDRPTRISMKPPHTPRFPNDLERPTRWRKYEDWRGSRPAVASEIASGVASGLASGIAFGPDPPRRREVAARRQHLLSRSARDKVEELLKRPRRVADGAACARRQPVHSMRSLLPFTRGVDGLHAGEPACGARSRPRHGRRLHTEMVDLRFARIDGYMDDSQSAAGEEVCA